MLVTQSCTAESEDRWKGILLPSPQPLPKEEEASVGVFEGVTVPIGRKSGCENDSLSSSLELSVVLLLELSLLSSEQLLLLSLSPLSLVPQLLLEGGGASLGSLGPAYSEDATHEFEDEGTVE